MSSSNIARRFSRAWRVECTRRCVADRNVRPHTEQPNGVADVAMSFGAAGGAASGARGDVLTGLLGAVTLDGAGNVASAGISNAVARFVSAAGARGAPAAGAAAGASGADVGCV